MSGEPIGIATFPGVQRLLEASITLAHGISPSVATLTIVPQGDFTTQVGTLAFWFGGIVLGFAGCKVDSGSFERNSAGDVWRLSVLDRRWRWRFGQISGTYNVRRDDFSLQDGENGTTDTERTPRQLAALCLEAMGETDFEVGDLPNEARPSVEWECQVPAEALAALCDELGCRVVLQLDGRVAIRRLGIGAILNADGALEYGIMANPPEIPDAIAVVCGANRYQVDFRLEAVGLEKSDAQPDERLVPIDELSYMPTGGWSHTDVPYFHQVEVKSRDLAQRSVFRYYRIKTPVEVPGYDGPDGNRVDRLEQVLPIEDEQVAVAGENSQPASLPASVFGVWYPETGDVANSAESLRPAPAPGESGETSPGIYERPFAIDSARGLVIFDEPVYRNTHASATGGSGYEVVIGPAELVLRAACGVRHDQTFAIERYVRARPTGSQLGTATRYLRHDEIVLHCTPTYSEDYALIDVATNIEPVNEEADRLLDAAEQEYQVAMPQTVRYAGIVPIELDGAIQQITFNVGRAGATTAASRHNERARDSLPHDQRRRIERARDSEETKTRTTPRNLARALKANLHIKPRPHS